MYSDKTMSKESFLTDRQIQILEMRKKGLSQSEIARVLGTTRANISATERTARDNIVKAEKTVQLAKMLDAKLWIHIEKDADLSMIPKKIYEKAGNREIHVNMDTPTLLNVISQECRDRIKGRRVISDFEVGITKDGEVLVR